MFLYCYQHRNYFLIFDVVVFPLAALVLLRVLSHKNAAVRSVVDPEIPVPRAKILSGAL